MVIFTLLTGLWMYAAVSLLPAGVVIGRNVDHPALS
jgi:hypothetical protein